MPKVTILVFRVPCDIRSNQSKECECIMEFPLSHFYVLIEDLSGYESCKSAFTLRRQWLIFVWLPLTSLMGATPIQDSKSSNKNRCHNDQ